MLTHFFLLEGYMKFLSVCDRCSACSDSGVEQNSNVGQVGFIWGCNFRKIKMFSKSIYGKCELGNLAAGLFTFENF